MGLNTTTPNVHEREKNTIKIWQQNVNKSRLCQHDLISSGRLTREGIDIIALQEPYINYIGGTITSNEWTVIFPTIHKKEPAKTRSIIFIRTSMVTDRWSQIDINSEDITAIKIYGDWGTLALFNAYIDCNHDRALEELVSTSSKYGTGEGGPPQQQKHTIWLGDFNRHHPHWDSPADNRLFTTEARRAAERLIDAIANAGLEMALPPGTATHQHNVTKKWTRLDQVFLSEHSLETLISCDVDQSARGICTDHLPIRTELNMSIAFTPTKIIENFRDVDWEKFRTELRSQLAHVGLPGHIEDQQSLDEECDNLTKAIKATIDSQVPTSEISPKAKRWWTKELSSLRRSANKLGRIAHKFRSNPKHSIHTEAEAAKKQYAHELERSKRQHWRDWLEKATDPDIWTAHRYVSAASEDGNNTRIPTLRVLEGESETTASTNEEKSNLLVKTFFPPERSKTAEVQNAEATEETTPPICKLNKITMEQIERHLAKLKPYKAPGPDGIPNIVLTKCADVIKHRLYNIYNAMTKRKLYYEPWKQFTTVVLRKPGKPKYNVPKAYRPIALINTLIKVLTAILAEQLMYYAEYHKLLPANHFGGRRGRNATDAVQMLTHKIKAAWRKGKVASVLFLDIEGAFPNADNAQLIQNLTKRRIPSALVSFVARMLKDRSTVLKFDGYISDTITLNNGIGQGDPLSMALYQFYNADLIEIPKNVDEEAIAYVDDAILIATGSDFVETHETLAEMMTRANGAIEWAEKHNSRFEYSKLALIDFSHHSRKLERPPLALPNTTVKPVASTKYLGVYLDQNLLYKEQLAYIAGKGSTWAAQIRRLSRPSWGLTPSSARKLYIGAALPKILYGIEIWCPPQRNPTPGRNPPRTTATRKLTTAQRAGTLAITGGFRTTPTDVLDAHAALLPVNYRLDRTRYMKTIRLASLSAAHPLQAPFKTAFRRKVKRHKSSLHELAGILKHDPDAIETIPVVRINPALKRKAPIKVSMPRNKEDSKREDAHAKEEVKVYSDGSIHDGQVGAAAVMYRKGKYIRSLRLHLGPAEDHTIYEAELVGLLLAIHLIATEKRCRVPCAIGADNQAAIKALHSELTKPGQHLAAEFLTLANKVAVSRMGKRSKYSLTVRWTAGHVNIKGNEHADEEAKNAASGNGSPTSDLPKCVKKRIKKSTSALKQDHNKMINNSWKTEWNAADRFKRFKAPDLIVPTAKKFITLTSSDHRITKQLASLLFQLRTGHAPLNSYLSRFKRVDSARCPACGREQETPEHFILRCPKYEHERWALLRHFRDNAPKLEDILSNPKAIIPVLHYIEATERFKMQADHEIQAQAQAQIQE